VRENLLMKCRHYSDQSQVEGKGSKASLSVLETLAEIRETTLNYLEALCLWRQSIPDADALSPRVFFWYN
jgi:hypothetical protein